MDGTVGLGVTLAVGVHVTVNAAPGVLVGDGVKVMVKLFVGVGVKVKVEVQPTQGVLVGAGAAGVVKVFTQAGRKADPRIMEPARNNDLKPFINAPPGK